MARFITLSLASILVSGCVSNKKLLKIASYDLECPADELTVTKLRGANPTTFGSGKQVGVDGCGQRLRYVHVLYTGWVADVGKVNASRN